MRNSATSRIAGLLVVLLGFACGANAAEIFVSNASFEMPTAPPGGYGGNPVSWYYGGMAQVLNTEGNTPPALDGSQVLVLGGQQASWVYQDLNATWSGNYNYTLTLYGAYPSFSGQTPQMYAELRNATDNSVLGVVNQTIGARDGWRKYNIVVPASTAALHAGHRIRVFIRNWFSGAAPNNYLVVDSVSLEATTGIANAGFESPATKADTWGGNPLGWTVGGFGQVLQPVVNTPAARERSQVLGLRGQDQSWVFQSTAAAWSDGYDYSFTAYGARPSFSPSSPLFWIELREAGGTALDTKSLQISMGGWQPLTANVSAETAAAHQGEPVSVFVRNRASNSWLVVDDLQLAMTPREGQSGTWISPFSGDWPEAGNWLDGLVAIGLGNTAVFSADLSADTTVTLNGPRPIGGLSFTDTGPATPFGWILDGASGSWLDLPANATPTISVVNATDGATIAAELRGTQGFNKTGNGTLSISAENHSLTGQVTVSEGRLRTLSTWALGQTDVIVSSGATLEEVRGSSWADTADAGSITLNGTGIGGVGALKLTGSGWFYLNRPITLASTSSINVDSGMWAVARNAIDGPGGLTKIGSGRLDLNAANTFAGATTISQGTVRMNNASALDMSSSITISNGATLEWNANGDQAVPIFVSGSGVDGTGAIKMVNDGRPKSMGSTGIILEGDTAVWSGASCGMYLGGISGSANLIKLGDSLLDLEYPSPSFTGNTICKEGWLGIRHFSDSWGAASGSTILWKGTGLRVLTDEHSTGGVTYNSRPLIFGGGPSSADCWISKQNVKPGTPATTDVLTGSVAFNAPVRIYVTSPTDELKLSGSVSGSGNITMCGPGMLTLSGSNTYAGNVIVKAGVLNLSGANNKLPDGGWLNVAYGAMINLESGVDETIGKLVLGNVGMPAGTYGSTSSSATYKNDTYFSGTGILRVATSTPNVTVGEAKGTLDSLVSITGAVFTKYIGPSSFFDVFLESTDRSAGMAVKYAGADATWEGKTALVTGTVKLDDASGSLYLEAQTAEAGADSAILPLGMVNRSAGGGVFANQAATVNGVGLNSVGLLVRVWGYASSLGGGYYSLSDGSAEAVRVLVLTGTVPSETVWAATGVLSTYKDGSDVRPLLIVKDATTDIQGF